MANKSRIINKFAEKFENIIGLFSKNDDRKYGEIVVVNDPELPSVVVLAKDGDVDIPVAIHNTSVEVGVDIVVEEANENNSLEYTISHAEVDKEVVENSEITYGDDKKIISNIEVSSTGHVTKIETDIVPQQLVTGVTVDDINVVSDKTAKISFDTLVKVDVYNEKTKEIDNNISVLSQTVSDNKKAADEKFLELDETIKTGVKNPYSITIDGQEYDGSEEVVVEIVKNVAGLTQNTEEDKLYLVGGKSQENAYGQTYTEKDVYIQGTAVYSEGKKVATEEYVGLEVAKIVDNAPDAYNTLKEIAEYIATDTTNAANVAVSIANLNADNVIGRGNVDKSAILKGLDNIAVSEGSIALGNNVYAGLSGYYISAINTANNSIWLTNADSRVVTLNPTDTLVKTLALYDETFAATYAAGDKLRITLFGEDKFEGVIESIVGNKVVFVDGTLNNYQHTNLTQTTYTATTEEFTLYSVEKPRGGVYNLATGAFAEGKSTKALGPNSHAAGIGTQAFNEGEFATGKYNKSVEGETRFSIGVGTSDSDRRNAFEVKEDGVYIEESKFSEIKEKAEGNHTHEATAIVGGTNTYLLQSQGEGGSTWINPNELKVSSAQTADVSNKALSLENGRTIDLEGAVEAGATEFNGQNSISIPVTELKESYLTWDDRALSGKVSPVEFAATSLMNGNKFAFANPEGITIEYSQDNGETWVDYGATDEEKTSLVSGLGGVFYVGKRYEENTVGDKLRVTFNAKTMNVYTEGKRLLLNVSTNYAGNCTVDMEYALFSEPDVWVSEGCYDLNGWSGWNSIPLNFMIGGGNSPTTQREKIRLTLNIGNVTENVGATVGAITDENGDVIGIDEENALGYSEGGVTKGGLTLLDVVLLGATNWTTPSELARTGHMYSYDANKNVSFPKNVNAETFNTYTVEEFLSDSATTYEGHYEPSNVEETLSGSSTDVSAQFGVTPLITGIDVDGKGHIVAVNTMKLPSYPMYNYYTKEEVDNIVDGIDVTEQLENYYTKEETYSKTEIDQQLSTTVASVATTKDIIIEGGPLAEHFETYYSDYKNEEGFIYMPSGVTFTEFVEMLLCSEKYPDETFTSAYYSNSISAPSISANNSDLVEVGTTVTFNNVTSPTVSVSTRSMSVGGLNYGYKTTLDGTINTSKTISSSVSTSQTSGSYYTISASQSGFKSGALPSTVTGTTAPTLGSCSLVAGFGTNTYTVNVSGATFDYSYVAIPSVYIVSNLKNTKEEEKTTARSGGSGTMSRATNSNSYTVTGVYPIYTNISGDSLLGDATQKESLTNASTITIYNIPSEVVNGKHFMFDFPASKNITKAQKYVPGLGLQDENTDGYIISGGITKTINGVSYQYKRFKFTTATNGELDYIKITFDSNLSVE